MIGRRNFVLGTAALLLASKGIANAELPIPNGNKLEFQVLREDSVIGSHMLTFDRAADGLIVHIAVDLAVKFGPITLYRYKHRATETWRSGVVTAIDADTDDNGKKFSIHGRRSADGLVVEGTGIGRYTAPENALPATHWNRAMLDGPMINTQNGQLMRPKVTSLGVEDIQAGQNRLLSATHYVLSGDVDLDTWYDATSRWVGIRFKAGEGSLIQYRKVS
jgi:hypothetical protein